MLPDILRIPPEVLGGPNFTGRDRKALSMASKALQELVMRSCTAVTVRPRPEDETDLQELVVDRLHHFCSQGLRLEKLVIEGNTDITVEGMALDRMLQVTGLTPLASLTGLKHLRIADVPEVSDLAPFAALTALQHLDCSGVKEAADLAPLTALQQLHSLITNGLHQVNDLGPLQTLAGLQHLDCTGMAAVSDLGPLTALTNLTHLVCTGMSEVSDLSPVTALTRLQRFEGNHMQNVTDVQQLTKLSALPCLQHLVIGCKVADLKWASLGGLRSLDISGMTDVTNLEPLIAQTNLTHLKCSDGKRLEQREVEGDEGASKVTDLKPLALLSTNLQHLSCRGMLDVTDISPLQSLARLRYLDLGIMEQVRDLKPLSHLTHLTYLDCTDMKADSIGPLATLENLEHLVCHGMSDVSSLEPLSTLTKLTHLDFGGMQYDCTSSENGVTELKPLSMLQNLQYLSLERVYGPADISPIAALHGSLRVLNISAMGHVEDLSPLSALSNLRSLDCQAMPRVKKLDPLTALTNLRYLNTDDMHSVSVFDRDVLDGMPCVQDCYMHLRPEDVDPLICVGRDS